MKILMINSVCGISSTGRICTDRAVELEMQGHDIKIGYGRENVPKEFQKYAIRIGTNIDVKMHVLYTRITDNHAFGSKKATLSFLKWAEEYNPDLIWLHNLHGYYINVQMLFEWIKGHPQIQVKWTLHDCWAFTGHCAYFSMIKCEQWKNECKTCQLTKDYPSCYGMSNVRKNYEIKKKIFTGVKNMMLITPSQWLADLVQQSFLKEYPIEVVYNTIDTNIFKPTPSNFRKKYGLDGKIIVLGVASYWSERKGIQDFYKLAEMLDDKYVIVLVGLTKKQIDKLPKMIKGITRTNSAKELAAIYTAADVFVNTSREETFGMTPVEAQACGTPSIVYQNTACEEVARLSGNKVVPQNVYALYEAITGHKFSRGGGNKTAIKCMLICIPNTNSPIELAEIYTAADYFLNPTYEDNYPTVNLEAQACGTTIISYDTGGCKETFEKGI